MESGIEMFLDFIERSFSILVTILGGLFFSKLVYRNMMRKSKEGISEDTSDDALKIGSNTKNKIIISEFTNRDIVSPASIESFNNYIKIFKIMKIRFVFVIGCIVFPILFLMTIPMENKYFLIAALVMFIIFILGLISIYIKNIYNIKKISKTLVILRVFGSRTNTQFLFNQIASLWNYLGTTFTIMDPVYARSEFRLLNTPKNLKIKIAQFTSFIPGAVFVALHSFNSYFFDFLFVPITTLIIFMIFLFIIADSLFIKDVKSLLKKIHINSNFIKRYNGIGRQINLYCFDNIWKKALREMLGRADLTVMDLRGFSYERKGCAFEISHLVNNFNLDNVLFIINKKTDRNLLLATIQQETDMMIESSPNADKNNLNITIYSCEKQNIKDTQQILRILCNKLSNDIETTSAINELSFATFIPVVKIPVFLISILAGIVFTLTLFFGSYSISHISQLRSYENAQNIVVAPPPGPLEIYELPGFFLATADIEPHFVKMTISLAYYPNPELGPELINRKNEIQHIIHIILQGKTFKELDNTSGVITLSEEIKSHINMRLMTGKISEIYFKEFIIN